MTVLTETFSTAPAVRARFSALRTALVEAVKKRRVYRKTLTELENLTNRELADMGIAPMSIREIAYEAAYGK